MELQEGDSLMAGSRRREKVATPHVLRHARLERHARQDNSRVRRGTLFVAELRHAG
jgi:hypothetical protein